MACNCKDLKNRLERTQIKYAALRKNHKKLLGFTVLLTNAIENFIKHGVNIELIDILDSCTKLHSDFYSTSSSKFIQMPSNVSEAVDNVQDDDVMKGNDPATESEREYYEGFLARPKIPRTPQQ